MVPEPLQSRDMQTGAGTSPFPHTAACAAAFACALPVVWIGAWLLERALEGNTSWLDESGARSLYWLGMKLLLWIAPSLVLIRLSGRSAGGVMGLSRVREIIVWGGGVGLALGVTALAVKWAGHRPLFASAPGWPLFSGVVVAPLVEEFTFRGALMGALAGRFRFWSANLLTAAFFLAIHLPGWHFQGCLLDNLKSPAGGALSIFLLGLVFGYVVHRTRSVAAGTLAHALNNLFNA
ncbi:MAG: CPBP family intramembrane metalloprotease [Candidatus Hydrogenedentes bacterium]|nr:CPBP family intramembrane metalloprotease [Candidatus Hydrogenedentota bacterium]